MSPPMSVHLSFDSTCSISATFGHGFSQPPAGVTTSMTSLSATLLLQSLVECPEPGTTLSRIQRLSQVERGQDNARSRQLPDGVQINPRGS